MTDWLAEAKERVRVTRDRYIKLRDDSTVTATRNFFNGEAVGLLVALDILEDVGFDRAHEPQPDTTSLAEDARSALRLGEYRAAVVYALLDIAEAIRGRP